MSARSLDSRPWSARRWACILASLMAAQFLLLWRYAGPTPLFLHPSSPPTIQRLICDKDQAAALSPWLDLCNPTLFAKADAKNFSGPAWLNQVQRANVWQEWSTAADSLPMNAHLPDLSFNQYLHNHPSSAEMTIEKSAAPLTDFNVPIAAVITQSLVRIEGSLAQRSLLSAVQLPGWTNTETLPDTEVEIAVGSEGWPQAVRLVTRCGWPPADDGALKVARSFRFQPMEAADSASLPAAPSLTWGRAVFHWLTLTPLKTNETTINP